MSQENQQFLASAGPTFRLRAGGGRTGYGATAIAFHWATAVLVVAEFALAQSWGFAGRPAHHLMIVSHMSLGIVLSAVLVARIAWRLVPGHRVAPVTSGWIELASKAVHSLLYALLVAQAVLGFVLRWSGNEAMSFFGLLIAPPFPPFSKPAHGLVAEAHEWIGWAIVILAAGHAAAALLHHYVLHDDVLSRMLPWRDERPAGKSDAYRR